MEDLQDAKLYFDRNMERTDLHSFAGGQTAVYLARNPLKTSSNEDAAGLIPLGKDTGVLVVADGMGGGAIGEDASRLAVRTLRSSIVKAQREEMQLRSAVLNGIEAANRAVADLGVGAATTLAVVEIQARSVRTYHVGDSMILAVGQRGKVRLQTVCHSPVGYAVEAGVLDEKEALHHKDRHLVSNMIGLPDMRIEVGSHVKLSPRDTLLLASDGLFDNIHVEEIVETIRKGSLECVVDNLARRTWERMTKRGANLPSKSDDLTLLAFRPTLPRRTNSVSNTNDQN